jgi:hypothetical protein
MRPAVGRVFSFPERHLEFPRNSISLSKLDSHVKIYVWVSSGHLSVHHWLVCKEVFTLSAYQV